MKCRSCGAPPRTPRAIFCTRCRAHRHAAQVLIANSYERSRQKGLEHSLTDEWVRDRLAGGCEVTGLPFVLFRSGQRGITHAHSPSLDRINPMRGYTTDNTRLVVLMFNRAKGINTDEEFFELCRTIVNTSRRAPAKPAGPVTPTPSTRTATPIALAARPPSPGVQLRLDLQGGAVAR